MSNAARNDYTVEEAQTKFCPYRAALPQNTCVATGCMAWRFSWDSADGFEEETEEGIDWGMLETEPVALDAYLTRILGENGHEMAGRLIDCADEGDAENIREEIDNALEEALTPGADVWAAEHKPEGDGWGLKVVVIEQGRYVATFQRPSMKRGGCGLAGRLS